MLTLIRVIRRVKSLVNQRLRLESPDSRHTRCGVSGRRNGGDGLSVSIAAASIIAKVTRDRLMIALHEQHPVYAWHRNKGYGTEDHMHGLAVHGCTPHHRRSFAPIHHILYGANLETQI